MLATMRSLRRSVILTCAALGVAASSAHAQVFTNPAPILIRDGVSPTYPSTIAVSGVTEPIGNITVRLQNVTHTWAGDIVVALAAPDGRGILLAGRCGGGTRLTNVSVGFSSDAPDSFAWLDSGVFRVATCFQGVDVPAPGPAAPYLADLSDFLGSDANGTWSLYVYDGASGDFGSVQGGWSIEFSPIPPAPAPEATAFTYQGLLTQDGEPFNGTVAARFRVFSAEQGGTLLAPLRLLNLPVENGLISTAIDVAAEQIDPANPPWLEVAINGVALQPRTRLSPTPVAAYAARAVQATEATTATTALTAQSVAWNNIQNRPIFANWQPGPTPSSASIAGAVAMNGTVSIAGTTTMNSSAGIGGAPVTNGRLLVTVPSIVSDWNIIIRNDSSLNFLGGARLTNSGFLEMTNGASLTNPNVARLSGTGGWTAVSDARLKTDIRPALGMLDAAMKLRPVYFHWLNDASLDPAAPEDFGLIAQEVQDIFPRLVVGNEQSESLTVNYSQLSVIALAAIQELKSQHETELATLRAELTSLQSELATRDHLHQQHADALQARLERLEAALASKAPLPEPR